MKEKIMQLMQHGIGMETEYGHSVYNVYFSNLESVSDDISEAYSDIIDSLEEFVDYYADMKPVLNDELQAMLDRAEEAIKKATT